VLALRIVAYSACNSRHHPAPATSALARHRPLAAPRPSEARYRSMEGHQASLAAAIPCRLILRKGKALTNIYKRNTARNSTFTETLIKAKHRMWPPNPPTDDHVDERHFLHFTYNPDKEMIKDHDNHNYSENPNLFKSLVQLLMISDY